jgi:hypothetical protein
MTKLILAPFDPHAPGSHMQRVRLMEITARIDELQNAAAAAEDAADAKQKQIYEMEAMRLYLRVAGMASQRLRTDDGTAVSEALEQLSADDFDRLLQGMLAVAENDTVPLASKAP